MVNYGASIQLNDRMSPILNNILNAMNMTVNSVYEMQTAVSGSVDLSSFDAIRSTIAQAEIDWNNLQEEMQKPVTASAEPQVYTWSTDGFEVFTDTGIDRFSAEAQSAMNMMNQLSAKQSEIAARAASSDVFSPSAITDMNNIGQRINMIKESIEQVAANPVNPLDPNASNALEQMRQQFSQALDYQNQMNEAVENLDVERANSLFRQLNSVVNATEQNLRDNVTAQGQFNSAVKQGTADTQGLSNVASKIGSAIKSAFGGKNIADFKKMASEAVEFASDLTEVQNVVDVTFSSSAETVDKWATTTLNAFGLNELSAKQYSGTMGAMLKSSGLTGDKVSEMSMKITELSGDMASFYNLDNEAAFNKIRSGISGETEPLKQLGINMSVANLEAYALSQGIKTAYKDMSQSEQTLLRYNYLLTVTSDAQGDFARTQDSYANQTKLLSENWKAFTGNIASTALPRLAQLAARLNTMFSSAEFQTFADGMSRAINAVLTVAGGLLTVVQKIGSFFVNNWSLISPVIMGIVAALAAYAVYLGVVKAAEVIGSAVKIAMCVASYAHAVATRCEASENAKLTATQHALNTALLGSPVTWIIVVLIALIAVIFLVIAAIKKVTGTTTSALGMIFGAVCWVGALILNTVIGLINGIIQFLWTRFVEPFIGIVEWILNACNGGFDSFGGAVANLVGNIISWFLSLGQVVTKIIDAIFGTNWTAELEDLKNTVTAWGKNDNAISISREAPQIDYRMDMTDAYDWGAAKGDEWSESIRAKFGVLSENEEKANTLLDIEHNTANTASDTSDIKDSVKVMSDSELEYLRQIADREAINKFTTAEIKLDVISNATVNTDLDIDGYIDDLTSELAQVLVTTAEGLEQ